MTPKSILLIDPLAFNFDHAMECREYDHNPFTLITFSLDKINDPSLTFDPSSFEEVFYFIEIENHLNTLKDYNFLSAIPCDQLSLRSSDKIAHSLGLICNSVSNKERVNNIFLRDMKVETDIQYHKDYYYIFYLDNPTYGIDREIIEVDEITGLKSYDTHEIYSEINIFFPETEDLTNAWGKVVLVNSDEERLKADASYVHKNLKIVTE